MRSFIRKRWIALLLITIVIAFFSAGFRFSLFLSLFSMSRIVEWVSTAQQNHWMVGFFYAVYIVGVMVFPITLFPIIGGVLLPIWIALPLNVVAATAGGWLAFRTGRSVGRRIIEPFMRGNLKVIDQLTESKGVRTVCILRLIGVPPFAIANFGLGLSAVRNRDFLMGTAAGILPWMTLVTYLSTSLWQAVLVGGQKGLAKALLKAGAPLTAVSITVTTVVATTWFLKRRRNRQRHSNL